MEKENTTILKVGDAVRHLYDIQRDIMVVGLIDKIDDVRGKVRILWASPPQPKWMRWYQKHLIVKIS